MKKFSLDQKSPVPLYLQVRQELENHIRTEHIAPGEALPTLTEISEAASVSIRTVQKALQDLLDKGICHRSDSRKLIMGQLPAENVVNEKRDIIILCYQMGEKSDIAMRILAGLQSEIENMENLEVVLARAPFFGSLRFYQENPSLNVLGVVLVHWQSREGMVELASEFSDMRFVHLNYAISDLESLPDNICGIYNDDYAGGYQGAEYLLANNVEHPAFFELRLSEYEDTYRLRREGFLAALRDNGKPELVFEQSNVANWSDQERMRRHAEFFAKTFAEHPEIDGVLASYDQMADGINSCLIHNGLSSKVRLLGYDGLGGLRGESFSGIEVKFSDMGRKAVRFLVSPEGKPRFLRLLPQLVIRNSDEDFSSVSDCVIQANHSNSEILFAKM